MDRSPGGATGISTYGRSAQPEFLPTVRGCRLSGLACRQRICLQNSGSAQGAASTRGSDLLSGPPRPYLSAPLAGGSRSSNGGSVRGHLRVRNFQHLLSSTCHSQNQCDAPTPDPALGARATEKHRIAIRIESVFLFDGFFVGCQYSVFLGKGAGQHEQS